MQLLQTQGAAYFPRTQEIRFDAPMIWLMVGLAISSALIFGLVPALQASGGSVRSNRCGPVERSPAARASVACAAASWRRSSRLRRRCSIVAALLLTSLDRLRQVDLGFDTDSRADRIDSLAGRAVPRRRSRIAVVLG